MNEKKPDKEKRPPLDVSELGLDEEHKKGPLTFVGNAKGEKPSAGVSEGRKSRLNILQFVVTVAIAVAISVLIIFQFAGTKGNLQETWDIANAAYTQATSTAGQVNNILGSYVKSTDLANYATDSELSTAIAGVTAPDLSSYATDDALDAAVAALNLTELREDILAEVDEAVAAVDTTSSLDYYLAGSAGSYTLTVESDRTGEYVGRVTLVYDTPIPVGANLTEAYENFYTLLSPLARNYIPQMIYLGSQWKVVGITFNTLGFTLVKDVEAAFPMTVGGLGITFGLYNKIYVEVLPGSVEGAVSGGGI